MRLTVPLAAASVGAILVLAACGSSSSPNDDAVPGTGNGTISGPGGNAGAAMDPNVTAPAPEIPGAQKGGTLSVLAAGGNSTFDPTEAYYTNTGSILSGLVTRSLTQYMYDPKTKDMVLVPDLATDLGRPNRTFTQWTFTLRPGVKFSDGTPVTPKDLVWGIERSFDRSTFPGGASYSNDYFKNGDTFKGPYTDPGGSCHCVSVNGQEITISMSQPFPDMPYWAAFPAMGPIPPGDASDPAKYKLHPLATGPYMFKDYTPNQSLTLVKNPYWDPNTDPVRHQYINDYTFSFDREDAQIDQILLTDNGDAQTSLSYDRVLSATYGQFMREASDRLVQGSAPCTFMLSPDYRKITDIEIRKALVWAYPYRDAWAAGGYIPGVTRIPGGNILPPGTPGRLPFEPLPGHQPAQTDAAKAKQILKASGHLGYKLVFPYYADDPNSVAVKNVVVQAYKDAGFDPQPFASTTTKADEITQPDWVGNLRTEGWCSDWPSGGSWFPPVFGTTDLQAEGLGVNNAVFSEPSVDARIAAIEKMGLDKQPAAWNALDRYMQRTYLPVIVTGYGGTAMMRGSKVMGMDNDPVFGMPTWKTIWLKTS